MTGPFHVTRYDQIITCDQTPKNAYNTEDIPSPSVPEETMLSVGDTHEIMFSVPGIRTIV